MYILIVARGFPQINNPLQGIFEFDQAKALKSIGHKVVYLSLDLRSIRRKRKLGKYWTIMDGINILNISIPLGKVPAIIRFGIGKFGLRIFYKDILNKQGKPDLIHAHFSGIGFMSLVLKEKLSIPLVITEHSSKLNRLHLNKQLKNNAQEAFNYSNRLITVSSALKKKIVDHFGIESYIVPNIVDTNNFFFYKNKKTDLFTFISVGNLIYSKGFDILIEAFKKADFNKNICLKIVGKGPEYKIIQNQINEAGLNNQIELLGFLNRTEISKIMHESDAFVLASRGETFGVVYIEAMLAGLPVIATACGGPEDFVTPENGLLVPVEDVVALKDALIKIHNEIDIYDKRAISENCKRNFSPENIAGQLTKIYRETLNNEKK